MRSVIYAVVLLVASSATAQPVTEPKACQVTIARAPDDVRAVVETWVQSEPQCSVALEVRIVPTEGGLYLLAQDEHGRIRERIVPDAQTAGVLVASWIADDNAPPVVLPPPAPVIPVAQPAAAIETNESVTPPGLAPVSLTATASRPVRRSKWLTAAVMLPIGEGAGQGVRADIDVFRRGRWYAGLAASLGAGEMPLMSSSGTGFIHTKDYKGAIYMARPSQFGRWELRPTVGVGVMHTQGLAYDGSSFYSLDGTFTTLEASVLLSRELGNSWAIYGGPLATVINQRYEVSVSYQDFPVSLSRGNIDLVMLTGVRHRL
ncbi:MAG TPA: hypothetical protein VFV99_26965 [Kofleriaceae bacterium]|nr:hypothetical protein [Kofleriaceae bacterium]